jgi:hypothetical protein
MQKVFLAWYGDWGMPMFQMAITRVATSCTNGERTRQNLKPLYHFNYMVRRCLHCRLCHVCGLVPWAQLAGWQPVRVVNYTVGLDPPLVLSRCL